LNTHALLHEQRGATLIVGLVMLAVMMLLVVSAFTLSTTNVKSVGNMQFRNEAVAAASKAIEQVIDSPFTIAPTADQISVDLNNDGKVDYEVAIEAPTCIRGSKIAASGGAGKGSSITLGLPTTPSTYNTIWDVFATVTDTTTGASARVHQGVSVLLSQSQYSAVCS
jgi:hypothetical protein